MQKHILGHAFWPRICSLEYPNFHPVSHRNHSLLANSFPSDACQPKVLFSLLRQEEVPLKAKQSLIHLSTCSCQMAMMTPAMNTHWHGQGDPSHNRRFLNLHIWGELTWIPFFFFFLQHLKAGHKRLLSIKMNTESHETMKARFCWIYVNNLW